MQGFPRGMPRRQTHRAFARRHGAQGGVGRSRRVLLSPPLLQPHAQARGSRSDAELGEERGPIWLEVSSVRRAVRTSSTKQMRTEQKRSCIPSAGKNKPPKMLPQPSPDGGCSRYIAARSAPSQRRSTHSGNRIRSSSCVVHCAGLGLRSRVAAEASVRSTRHNCMIGENGTSVRASNPDSRAGTRPSLSKGRTVRRVTNKLVESL